MAARRQAHRRKLSSTNMLERVMKDIKQRTAVVTIFPNDASLACARRASRCDRLVGARLLEIHEKWATEPRRYLNMDDHVYRCEQETESSPTESGARQGVPPGRQETKIGIVHEFTDFS